MNRWVQTAQVTRQPILGMASSQTHRQSYYVQATPSAATAILQSDEQIARDIETKDTMVSAISIPGWHQAFLITIGWEPIFQSISFQP